MNIFLAFFCTLILGANNKEDTDSGRAKKVTIEIDLTLVSLIELVQKSSHVN